MTTLTVWKFPDPDEAQRAAKVLQGAASEGIVTLVDHAVAVWPEGEDKPRLEHGHDGPTRGAAWGVLWGVLTGALFAVPVIGGVVGAGIGALSKITQGTGITEEDLARIRTEVQPGTSVLFVVTDQADLDRLGERFHFPDKKLVHTNLTEAERSTLLETFGNA